MGFDKRQHVWNQLRLATGCRTAVCGAGPGAFGLPLLGPGRAAGRPGDCRLFLQPHATVCSCVVGGVFRRVTTALPCCGIYADCGRDCGQLAQINNGCFKHSKRARISAAISQHVLPGHVPGMGTAQKRTDRAELLRVAKALGGDGFTACVHHGIDRLT